MENKKAWIVSYPSEDFGSGISAEVVFADTRSKALYAVLGEGDSTWTNMRARRAPSLDEHEKQFYNDERFRDLWYLNNGYGIERWTLPNGDEMFLNSYRGMTTADGIKDDENLPEDTEITYELLDGLARKYAHNIDYTEDISRIIAAAKAVGIVLSKQEAVDTWEDYSEEFAAGWLVLPHSNEELKNIIKDLQNRG